MSSNELEILKINLAIRLFSEVVERRKTLIIYLIYIYQMNIDEFSSQFNSYIYACTPSNNQLSPIALAILDDIICYIEKNGLSEKEISDNLHLLCGNEIMKYINGKKLTSDNTIMPGRALILESVAC